MPKTYFKTTAIFFGIVLFTGMKTSFYSDVLALAADDHTRNKAVHISIIKQDFQQEAAGHQSSPEHAFLVIETEWENIHPKQKVARDKLEGKADRTMGVGGLGSGGIKKAEYVEIDVAYQIPKLFDHAYLLADGLAIALHEATKDIPGGYPLQKPFTIAKQGEIRKAKLVYMVPESSKNLAFRLFDYQYGHVLVPVKGKVNLAQGAGKPPEKSLDIGKTETVELASLGLHTQPQYMDRAAPNGWTYAVAQLAGMSLSGGTVKDIVQIKPQEYTWVTTDGGYLYTCSASASAVNGVLRFTPEIYQLQELAFLVPETEKNFRLGVRVRNQVLDLDLGTKSPKLPPSAEIIHADGDIMEILVFDSREDNDKIVVDLGIHSLYDRGGLDIQMSQQFFLCIGEEEFSVDTAATASLLRHPPSPFTVPPGAFLRFELAFDARGTPTALRYRGYKGEAVLKF